MTIKQMAAMETAKLIVGMILVSVLVNVSLHFFGVVAVGAIVALALFVYMIKFVYDIELAKLEAKNSLARLKEIK